MHALRGKYRSWVVFHLLEDAEERDEEVEAIHHQTDAHQADERHLVVTQRIANTTFETVDAVRESWAGKLAVPRSAGLRGAGDEGSEEIVKRECECRGPSADEDDLEESVCEFPGSVPQAQGSAKILELRNLSVKGRVLSLEVDIRKRLS